jgi:hypothetical protein
MTLMPGESTTISIPVQLPDGVKLPEGGIQMQDISRQVYGKYQFGTMHWGLWYSDEDFMGGGGCGFLKWGSIPAPSCKDRRPWRGVIVELIRRAAGAPREK